MSLPRAFTLRVALRQAMCDVLAIQLPPRNPRPWRLRPGSEAASTAAMGARVGVPRQIFVIIVSYFHK